MYLIIFFIIILVFWKQILSLLNTHMPNRVVPNRVVPDKIVVFDLDETLGCFVEVGVFWDALEAYAKLPSGQAGPSGQAYANNKLTSTDFFEMLDIFPEFFRPNILKILKHVLKKKNQNACAQLLIYTNNQGPSSWVRMISEYFDSKLGQKVFDRVIGAYKINGRLVEPKRTSHEKSVVDLNNCADLPANAEICFIDDLYHPAMDKSNVYYINIQPYHVSLPFEEMATRYYTAKHMSNKHMSNTDFVKFVTTFMKQYKIIVAPKSDAEKQSDLIVSKKLHSYLAHFLSKKNDKSTRKVRLHKNAQTKHVKK